MPGSFKIEVQADVSGPLADGTAERVLGQWAANTARALGDEGRDMLAAVPMNKTGRARGGFQANLHVLAKGPVATVPGPQLRGVVWSPWLEGTSDRNETTGFKGYHLFRRTRTELQKKAPEIGDRELAKLLPQIGGA